MSEEQRFGRRQKWSFGMGSFAQWFINSAFNIYVFAYYFMECFHPEASTKWHGIWIIIIVCTFIGIKRIFSRNLLIIPLFLAAYIGIITFYYYLNTWFPIDWWLQVTLSRILSSLLPLILIWYFYSLWTKKGTGYFESQN